MCGEHCIVLWMSRLGTLLLWLRMLKRDCTPISRQYLARRAAQKTSAVRLLHGELLLGEAALKSYALLPCHAAGQAVPLSSATTRC